MKKLFILSLIFACCSSINIEILASKQEVQEILKAYLTKVSNQNLSISMNKEQSFGLGKVLTKQLAISDLIFNEDLIQIDLRQDPKSMKVFIWFDSFTLKLDVDILSKILNFQTQLNFEVIGLQLEATLLLQNNTISLQDEKLDNFAMKSIKLKKGEGKMENFIKEAINQLLNFFKSLMNETCAKQIIQFIKQDKWKKFLLPYISEMKALEVMNSENLKLTFSVDNSEIVAKISSIKSSLDL